MGSFLKQIDVFIISLTSWRNLDYIYGSSLSKCWMTLLTVMNYLTKNSSIFDSQFLLDWFY